jgi:hypothetical protein
MGSKSNPEVVTPSWLYAAPSIRREKVEIFVEVHSEKPSTGIHERAYTDEWTPNKITQNQLTSILDRRPGRWDSAQALNLAHVFQVKFIKHSQGVRKKCTGQTAWSDSQSIFMLRMMGTRLTWRTVCISPKSVQPFRSSDFCVEWWAFIWHPDIRAIFPLWK